MSASNPAPELYPIPQLVQGLGQLTDRYDVVLSDVWGVIHNGRESFPAACEALRRFAAEVGPVVLISNSPRPAQDVKSQLRELAVPDAAWTSFITSGDATRHLLGARAPQAAWTIGPDRDATLYHGLDLTFTGPETADFISCTGPYDDETETPEDYRARFQLALSRGLEMICANPDKVVQRGGKLIYCGGALADLYTQMGGTVLMAGLFGLIALRATGLGFLMLTLALSQVLWGTANRWVAVTEGDNGLRGLTRPQVFGMNLDDSITFYFFALLVAVFSFWMIARLVASPFGAALQGTRDQARRMSALGHNVWLIRWITFVYAGFWGGVSGLLFVYYHKYIHPASLSLTNSAEAMLSVIAGGAGTLAGPAIGAAIILLLKNYVSAYVERWNMLLGFVFVLIVVFMPDGLVPGIKRLWARWRRQ